MFAKVSALWYLLRHVGSAKTIMDKVNTWSRFCIIRELQKTEMFDYLREPRSFQEIRDRFEFRDEAYTTDVLVALANDADNILLFENGKYSLDTSKPLPTLEDMQRTLPPEVLGLHILADLAAQMLIRMCGEYSEFARRLERERSQLMNFDAALGSAVYDTARVCAYRWAKPYLKNLDGKTLLDVGCGSGREVAHLWLLLEGRVKITAVDPVPSFVELAGQRFPTLLNEIGSGTHRALLNSGNTPDFQAMSAGQLDFPDGHFDLVFHSGMLHWTSDPARAVAEMIRVLKPGGILFGTTSYRPQVSSYQHLLLRINNNVYGYPWYDDIVQWHRDNGLEYEHLVGGIYRARKLA